MTAKAAASSDTVTVACKLPHGLHLSRRAPDGQELWGHTVAGNAIKRDQQSMIPLPGQAAQEFGFALTPNVNKEEWEKWAHTHAALPAVKNGLIFAHVTAEDVKFEADVMKGQLSGLEPVDPTAVETVNLAGQRQKLETLTA